MENDFGRRHALAYSSRKFRRVYINFTVIAILYD